MNFGKGDKIKFLDEKGEGVIVSVSGDVAVVATADGFEISYPVTKLIHFDSEKTRVDKIARMKKKEEEEKIKAEELKKLQKVKKEKGPKFSKSHAEGKAKLEMEIDLHLEEILDNEKGMNNSEKLQYQLIFFRDKLEEAIGSNIKKIVFIHGIGNGRLKFEIRKELDSYSNLSYSDASYKRYGFGATEVIIR